MSNGSIEELLDEVAIQLHLLECLEDINGIECPHLLSTTDGYHLQAATVINTVLNYTAGRLHNLVDRVDSEPVPVYADRYAVGLRRAEKLVRDLAWKELNDACYDGGIDEGGGEGP